MKIVDLKNQRYTESKPETPKESGYVLDIVWIDLIVWIVAMATVVMGWLKLGMCLILGYALGLTWWIAKSGGLRCD